MREAEDCNITHPLDVTTVVRGQQYKMTLLAFSLWYKNKKMTEVLIENGASKTHVLALPLSIVKAYYLTSQNNRLHKTRGLMIGIIFKRVRHICVQVTTR